MKEQYNYKTSKKNVVIKSKKKDLNLEVEFLVTDCNASRPVLG